MEVRRRPLPTFTLDLRKQASSALGPLDKVSGADQLGGAAAEDPLRVESSEKSLVSQLMEPPGPEGPSSEVETKLSSEDSFSEEGSAPEDTLTEETRRKSEEEEAAKERAAQRQLLAVEELVQSERNYLKMLQICTVTIRSNLMKLQVPSDPPDTYNSLQTTVKDARRV